MPAQPELALAEHCAPVLLGKKAANLFSHCCQPQDIDNCIKELCQPGLLVEHMRTGPARGLCLLYRYRLLRSALANPKARQTLAGLGYPVHCGVEAQLGFLKARIAASADFPHEIGFFLGYPPDDVVGFIQNKGQCCKFYGIWKVYGSEAHAQTLFTEYEKCKQKLLCHLQNGGSIRHLCGQRQLAGAVNNFQEAG